MEILSFVSTLMDDLRGIMPSQRKTNAVYYLHVESKKGKLTKLE